MLILKVDIVGYFITELKSFFFPMYIVYQEYLFW